MSFLPTSFLTPGAEPRKSNVNRTAKSGY